MKKIFLAGEFTNLHLGHMAIVKPLEDFLLLDMQVVENPRHAMQFTVVAVECVKNNDYIPGFMSVLTYAQKHRPNILAVTPEYAHLDKLVPFCAHLGAELVVIANDNRKVTSGSLVNKLMELNTRELAKT